MKTIGDFVTDDSGKILYEYTGNDSILVIPEGVEETEPGKRIADRVKNQIKKIVFPTTMKKINSEAFLGTAVEEVIIPEGVTEIGFKAFHECLQLKEIHLPSTLLRIEVNAFCGNSCKKILIPEGVEHIESKAFCSCENLKEINIPETVLFIEENIIAKCRNLKTVNMSDEIRAFFRYENDNGMYFINPSIEKREGKWNISKFPTKHW